MDFTKNADFFFVPRSIPYARSDFGFAAAAGKIFIYGGRKADGKKCQSRAPLLPLTLE
jgi:hypothetical protein